ncbi:hypothetical protein BG004_003356 [Podila humilis]|nr:hypothetical protein BG004_003356 [Podila humilis]
MADRVSSESSFYWKLVVEPTVFSSPFCEPVHRSFVFEAKTAARHRNPPHWQCDIIENMINGVTTVAVEFGLSKNLERHRTPQLPSGMDGLAAVRNVSQRTARILIGEESPAELAALQTRSLHVALNEREDALLPSPTSQEDDADGDTVDRIIAIHTPKYLNPLMSALIRGQSTASIRLEVDAQDILHKGNYALVLFLCDEMSVAQIVTPTACHKIMDSIYHTIIPTTQPNQNSADVWFDFPQEAGSQQVHSNGFGQPTVSIGAHWRVISQYKSFARWIEQERQLQTRQHRLEEEKFQARRSQQGYESEMLRLQEQQRLEEQRRLQYPPQQLQMHIASNPPPLAYHPWYHSSFQSLLLPPPPLLFPPPLTHFYSGLDQSSAVFESVQGPNGLIVPIRPHTQTAQSIQGEYSDQFYAGIPSTSQTQAQAQALPRFQHPHQRMSFPPVSAQCPIVISVTKFSSLTFRVLLQYLYTGKIGLTDKQKESVNKYWVLSDSEPQMSSPASPSSRRRRSSGGGGGDSGGIDEEMTASNRRRNKGLGTIILPPLDSAVGGDSITGITVPSSQLAFKDMLDRMTSQETPWSDYIATMNWLPCSRQNQHLASSTSTTSSSAPSMSVSTTLPSSSSGGALPASSLSSQEGEQQQEEDFCTWESLALLSYELGLEDLHNRAIKALEYHCQMLVIRSLMHYNVIAEVGHNGFDEMQLDLQLAMDEHLLKNFLKLYEYDPSPQQQQQPLSFSSLSSSFSLSSTVQARSGRARGRGSGSGGRGGSESGRGLSELEAGQAIGHTLVAPIATCATSISSSASERERADLWQYDHDWRHETEGLAGTSTITTTTTTTTASSTSSTLLDEPECQEKIFELCQAIRSHFLGLQNILGPPR